MSESEREARAKLSSDYQRIMTPGYSSRWAMTNPGNQQILAERDALLALMMQQVQVRHVLRVLDLGCGNLSILPASITVDMRVGLDLLIDRLKALHVNHGDVPVVHGDGARLPFADGSFDVVVLSTMMTSVLDDRIRRLVGTEVERALRPGGALLWYDMRMPNPRNDATRAIGRRELRRLFPNLSGEVKSLTVVPVLARRLGSFAPRGYSLLRRLPFLRSHLAGCLLKRA